MSAESEPHTFSLPTEASDKDLVDFITRHLAQDSTPEGNAQRQVVIREGERLLDTNVITDETQRAILLQQLSFAKTLRDIAAEPTEDSRPH